MTERVRNFVFTLNNYDEKDIEFLDQLPCQYIVYGKEVAPTTGTPHLQGYIQLTKQVSWNKVRQWLKWSIRKAAGDDTQNYVYCTKNNNYTVRGEPKKQGFRNDLQTVITSVKQGKNMRAILEDCSNFQTIRSAEKVLQYYEQPRDSFTFVYWFYGKAGAGKTKIARKILGKECYPKDSGKFWNNYDGHENILIDDFRKDHFSFDYLLRILDRYPMIVETKGGSRQLKAKLIIITSDRPPWNMWSGNDLDQVFRRLSLCSEVRV